jgi:Holliday junction resolvase-like predicted endonuclease
VANPDIVTKNRHFQKAVRRGRQFEAEERAGWSHIQASSLAVEAPSVWSGRRGRIDILVDDGSGLVAIVEIKATDWDAIKRGRIRETALRHTRQIWRYIDDYIENKQVEVSPGIVYPFPPRTAGVREIVEAALDERGIQCVWRHEHRSAVDTGHVAP